MAQKTKLIFNPIANIGRAWPIAETLRPIVSEFGLVDWSGTVYPGHATELAYQAVSEGYEQVIALGGDGTVHEVINGLMRIPSDQRPPLGIVPIGSGNDFAQTLGISTKPEVALRQILKGSRHTIDIGLIEDAQGRREYCSNTLGIGIDAVINYRSHHIPVFQGLAIYFLALLQTIMLNYSPFKIHAKLDGNDWNDSLIMLNLANGCREGGGFRVAPKAQVADGLFEFCAVHSVTRPVMLYAIPFFLQGKQEHLKFVQMGQFKQLELSSNRPLFIHCDGETFAGFDSQVQQIKVQIIPAALQVLM
jgi:diacylglycerol kinase (ATP)